MTTPTFNNSYFITNRNDPTTIWVDSSTYVIPGPLSYYLSSTPYDQTIDDYSTVPWTAFLSDLETDLASTVDANGNANLVVYIHGLGNTFDDAIVESAAFGSTLASPGGFGGLLIAFDWPSYGTAVSALASYYATTQINWPAVNTSGTIRDNINGSVKSFITVIQNLLAIQVNNKPINLSIISHSEGNYMLLMGMLGLKQAGVASGSINNAMMLAADISAAVFESGQFGYGITDICKQVSVYYSGADADLNYSDYDFFAYHNPIYASRLGLIGPFAYPSASAITNSVIGIDCSQVTVNLGMITNVHGSYRSLPQTVADMSSILNSSSPTGRIAYPGGTNSYYLNPAVNTASGTAPRQGIYRRRFSRH
ncbi:MAG: alpha/beta hydrolase [Acidobacteria bacterium]|nr:alpha/beta hydrolase [Acidobacteriota bacterium]